MITLVLFVLGSLAATEGCGAGKQLIHSGGLSASEKQAIVDAHNRLRQSVALGQVSSQPPAANMMEMVWDDELAAKAQHWSDQCIPDHDRIAQRDVGRFAVGQNLAATWTTRPPSEPADSQPDFMTQINAWFDEVKIFGFKPISGGHGTGHYSQLVWGETSHVGCGFTFYFDKTRGYTKLYVCNYGPSGNVLGSNPYQKGSPSCSAFGLTDSSKYSGLCAASFTSSSSYQTVDNSYVSNVIPDSTGESKGFNYHFFNQYNNQYQYQYQNQKIDATPLAGSGVKAFQGQLFSRSRFDEDESTDSSKSLQQLPHTFLPVDTSASKSSPQLTRNFLPVDSSSFNGLHQIDTAALASAALKAFQEKQHTFLPVETPLKSLQQQPRTFLPSNSSPLKSLQQQLPRNFLPVDTSSSNSFQQQLPPNFLPVDTSASKSLQQQLPPNFFPVDTSSSKSLQKQLPRTFLPVDTSASKSLQQQLPPNFFPVDTSSSKSLQQQLPRTFLPVDTPSSKSLQQLPRTFLPVDSSSIDQSLFKSDSSNLLDLIASNLFSNKKQNSFSVDTIYL